ncbi:MAG: hypothetical protein ACFFDH_02800 [Promethearchaeota archaeon]
MTQILDKEKKNKENKMLEEFLILEEFPIELEKIKEFEVPLQEEQVKIKEIPPREKPIKKALLKLIHKSKYNPKYLEEKIPIEILKSKHHFRNYGVY